MTGPLIVLERPCCDTVRVPVLKVFDGDGFLTLIPNPELDSGVELAVRFGFIDAPEMGQPGGPEARDFLISLIGGRYLDIAILTKMDTGGIIDRHGRVVCVPFLTDHRVTRPRDQMSGSPRRHLTQPPIRNIELEMVLNGWAWVLTRYGPDNRYLTALQDARHHRRGIWAREDNQPPWEFKRRQRRSPSSRAAVNQLGLFDATDRQARCAIADCDGHLVHRAGRFGSFYGCSNFPGCRYSCSASS